ncbi:MAG TPA: O-antigen ligase family protein [bacterium]|nr:O-antigen ligase family protein [bacterium]
MSYYSSDARAARVVDQLLDMLLVATLLAAPLIFYTRGYDVFEFNKITVLRVLTTAAAGLMLFKLLFVRPLALIRSALDIPVLAWLAVCLVCTFHTVNWRLSVHGVYEDFEGITTWFMYVFLFWWPLQHVRSERQIRLLFGAVVLAGTIAGFYGLLQNFGIDFVPWNPDTYNPDRMFSTMGNPDFLAAYTVMSMPITFIFFLDLPAKIRTDRGFCTVLVVASVFAAGFLAILFNVDYFNTSPSAYGASDFGGMLLTLKFWIPKFLIAFPVICAVLLYFGRLRLILLLSLAGQLMATLFTKSRGGVFAMAALVLLFGVAAVFEVFGATALFSLTGLLSGMGLLGLVVFVFYSGIWENALNFAFVDHPWWAFVLFAGLLVLVNRLVRRRGQDDLLARNLNYVYGLALTVWGLFFIPVIRQTTFEMLERTSKLFHPSQVKITPRLFIWKSALAMLHDHFLLGSGLDTFQICFPKYREALYWILEWNGTPEKAHNFIMQTAATMGFVGLLVFAWMHAAWTAQSFRDWRRQKDESRRLLILAGFAAWLGFFVQNLFSFTVVGYGTLWWVLWGLMPAMQRTWELETAGSGGLDSAGAPKGWSSAKAAWIGGVVFLSLSLLACAAAGPSFFDDPGANILGLAAAAVGLACLVWVLKEGPLAEAGPGMRSWVLLCAALLGVFVYSWYSVRIWVADSFYKQGQVGINSNQMDFSVAMYQKACGSIAAPLSDDQMRGLYEAELPPAADNLRINPGLNPDQELYWVRLGIAFETAAAEESDTAKKMSYFQTALAVHQYTLEMNPINGYNFNNKGRVLRAMGDASGDKEYFQKALDHYNRATDLDTNNVYFNMDKATTLIALGRPQDAFSLCIQLMKKFPDFAMPYSYAGFMKMQAGQDDDAISLLEKSLVCDWKGDQGSEAVAATNLAQIFDHHKRWADATQAYRAALAVNPDLPAVYLALAADQNRLGQKSSAVATLQQALTASPGDATVEAALKKLGATP